MVDREEFQRRISYLRSTKLLSEALNVKINNKRKLSNISPAYVRPFFRLCERMTDSYYTRHCENIEEFGRSIGFKEGSKSIFNTMKYFKDNNIVKLIYYETDEKDRRKKRFRLFINPCYYVNTNEIPIALVYLFWKEIMEFGLVPKETMALLAEINELSGYKLIDTEELHKDDGTLYVKYKSKEIKELIQFAKEQREKIEINDEILEFRRFSRFCSRSAKGGKLRKNRYISMKKKFKSYTYIHTNIFLGVIARNPFRESREPDKLVALFHPLNIYLINNKFFEGRSFTNLPQGKALKNIGQYQYKDIVDLRTGEIIYQLGVGETVKPSCISYDLSEEPIDYFMNDINKPNKLNKKYGGDAFNEDGINKLRDKYQITYCGSISTAKGSIRRDNE